VSEGYENVNFGQNTCFKTVKSVMRCRCGLFLWSVTLQSRLTQRI